MPIIVPLGCCGERPICRLPGCKDLWRLAVSHLPYPTRARDRSEHQQRTEKGHALMQCQEVSLTWPDATPLQRRSKRVPTKPLARLAKRGLRVSRFLAGADSGALD
jgi:hypothetical protein